MLLWSNSRSSLLADAADQCATCMAGAARATLRGLQSSIDVSGRGPCLLLPNAELAFVPHSSPHAQQVFRTHKCFTTSLVPSRQNHLSICHSTGSRASGSTASQPAFQAVGVLWSLLGLAALIQRYATQVAQTQRCVLPPVSLPATSLQL